MFGNKRTSIISGSPEQLETIIGKETQIKGTVAAGGTVRIDGKLEGEVNAKGDVIVGETGEVRAQLKARNATVAGVVYGDMDVVDKLELAATARLYGDIKTGTLIIGEGAVFKGACEMRHGKDAEISLKEGKAAPAKS